MPRARAINDRAETLEKHRQSQPLTLPPLPAVRERIVKLRELVAIIGCSRCTIWRWVRAGTFPQPLALGTHARGWLLSTVDWLRTRRAAV